MKSMKKYLLLILVTSISNILLGQCDGSPSTTSQIISSFGDGSNGLSATVTFTTVLPVTQTTGLISVWIQTDNFTTPTVNSAMASMNHIGTYSAADFGLPGTFYVHQFAGSTLNPANSFPEGVTIQVLSVSFAPAAIKPILVNSDLISPIFGDGSYFYYRTGIQVCANFEDNIVAPTNDVSLPIRLQSFTAQKLGANSSLLNWKSATEVNASHFEIERSQDAESWVKIGEEITRGSANYGAEYSFVDEEALFQRNNENTCYYRLKMVDQDGSSVYSDIRSVTFDPNGEVLLEAYPNPSFEFFNLKMSVGNTTNEQAQLQLFDMNGKLVKKQTVSPNGISKVDISELETGLYNVLVKHEEQTYRKRIIKTN